jgi:hypothetical protein
VASVNIQGLVAQKTLALRVPTNQEGVEVKGLGRQGRGDVRERRELPMKDEDVLGVAGELCARSGHRC